MNAGFLRARVRRHRARLACISLLGIASALATLALPWLLARLAGGITGEQGIDLPLTVALLLAAMVLLAAVTIATTILTEAASGRILAELRRETYAHLQSLPVSFHDRSRSAELYTLVSHEVQRLSTFLTGTLAALPAHLLTAAGAAALLFAIDPRLALIVPGLALLFVLGMKLLGRRLRGIARRVRDAEVAVFWQLESDLEALPAIKAFAVEAEHRARFDHAAEAARQSKLAETRITAFIAPLVALLAAVAAIALLLGGAGADASGAGAAGEGRDPSALFAFLLYAALLTRPVGSLADAYSAYQLASGALIRLETVFTAAAEPGYAAPRRIARAHGGIAFEAVSFAYPERPPVLERFTLAIAPGEIVALTGENGVGKSTLVNLLMRFYEPQAGRILLDGVDIAQLQVQDLRRQIGLVPQLPLLLNASIAENIAFGLDQPDPDAIAEAARKAQAAEFIARLPEGLATIIGDDGVQLSGGQRQRIALARALLRDPPIYVLDEATSMYDLDAEAAFVDSCGELLAGRTLILITHRAASLALAHRVLRIAPGGVTDITGQR